MENEADISLRNNSSENDSMENDSIENDSIVQENESVVDVLRGKKRRIQKDGWKRSVMKKSRIQGEVVYFCFFLNVFNFRFVYSHAQDKTKAKCRGD